MAMTNTVELVAFNYKNQKRFGKVIEKKMDKTKVLIYDSTYRPLLPLPEWFDNKELKRHVPTKKELEKYF